MHIALPGDPCYPAADGTLLTGASASTAAAAPSTQWHRMVRSSDPADAITRIYRPLHLHLTPSPPLPEDITSKL